MYVNNGPRCHIFGLILLPNKANIWSKVSFFRLFCNMFPLDSPKTIFLHSLALLLQVCIWGQKGYIFGIFWPRIWPKLGQKSRFSSILQKGSTGFTANLFSKLPGSTFRSVANIDPLQPYFLSFWPRIGFHWIHRRIFSWLESHIKALRLVDFPLEAPEGLRRAHEAEILSGIRCRRILGWISRL